MLFADLGLSEPILRAVETEGYTTATPIQAQAIPHVLQGRDVMGCAQTGTGKTAAFAMPILHRLAANPHTPGARPIRCLVLCPTRELAAQIGDSFRADGQNLSLRHVIVFGGVNQNPQVKTVRGGVDILVATPGRLLDLMNQGHINLRSVEVVVLDEADRMLDMGFINDIRRIAKALPAKRQTLLFSATIPPAIRSLANSMLNDPATVQVAAATPTADRIDQSVYFVQKRDKLPLLAHLVENVGMFRTIVFTRTKHGADKVVRGLQQHNIKAEAIHGNKSQVQRTRALANFTNDKTHVLVATDIASRGIDVDGISHVVNFDLTHEPETYVHRIGRTARAGASGEAISFCDPEEVPNLKGIERLIGRTITVKTNPLPTSSPRAVVDMVATGASRQPHVAGNGQSRALRRSGNPLTGAKPNRFGGNSGPANSFAKSARTGGGRRPDPSRRRQA